MCEPNPSKLEVLQRGRVQRSARLASCVALPLLLWGVPGCGGSSSDSQVNGSGSSGPNGQAGMVQLMLPGGSGASAGAGGVGSVEPGGGVYMLPADFTKAQLGGFKLGPAIDAGAAAGGTTGMTGTSCGTQILGVVRDFQGMAEMPAGHPDFEHFSGDDASLGMVKDVLAADQKPEYSAAPTSPFMDLAVNGDAANGQQTTDKAHFDQWYRATPNVNKPYIIYFYFEPSNGVLTFQSTAFFPLDAAGWGNTPRQQHNFGFTTEVHTQFNYKGLETFAFTGDDDLWVFINHKLAIDLGGLHPQKSKTISLDAEAAKLGITIGGTYDLDLFHAERHTSASNFRVDTNLAFTNCGTIIEEPPVK